MKILILCTGNSCRSQMAHGFLHAFDDTLQVFSAGTKPVEKVNAMAVQVMAEIGINISNHVPHSIEKYKDQEWDYVITVCDSAKESCPVFSGKVKHRLHIGFDDPTKATGTLEFVKDEFLRVRDEIKMRFQELYINQIKPVLSSHN